MSEPVLMPYTTGCVGKYEKPGALLVGPPWPVYMVPPKFDTYSGALASLQELWLHRNHIGNVGMAAFAGASWADM